MGLGETDGLRYTHYWAGLWIVEQPDLRDMIIQGSLAEVVLKWWCVTVTCDMGGASGLWQLANVNSQQYHEDDL